MQEFSHIFYVRLNTSFACHRSTLQMRKERMWGSYHCLRCSVTFVHDWKTFLSAAVKMKAFPSFYQFVTHTVFRELVAIHFPIVVKAMKLNIQVVLLLMKRRMLYGTLLATSSESYMRGLTHHQIPGRMKWCCF